MAAFPALAAIGGVGSILGGIFGASGEKKAAQAQIQAGRDQMQFAQDQYGLGSLGQLAAILGPDGIKRWLAQTPQALKDKIIGVKASNPTFTREQQQRAEELKRLIAQPTATEVRAGEGQGLSRWAGGAPGTGNTATAAQKKAWQAELDAMTTAAGGRTGSSGMIDLSALEALGPGLLGKYQAEADRTEKEGQSNLARYDAGTFGLDRMSRDIARGAKDFGKQQESKIRRDSAESLQNANRLATTSLMGRGLGASSALTDAYAGNARQNFNSTQDALGQLGDRQIQLQTGLQGSRLSLLGQRDQGRLGLALGGQDAARGLRTGALNVEQGALAGSDYSRLLGSQAANFYPSASPSGSYLSSLGSSLAGGGSALLGYGLGGYGGSSGSGRTLDQMRLDAARYGGMPYG